MNETNLLELLDERKFKELKEELETMHPVDIVECLEELDKKRQISRTADREKAAGKASGARTQTARPASGNRFHNFEGRNYNYDEAIWADIRKRHKKGEPGDGTE